MGRYSLSCQFLLVVVIAGCGDPKPQDVVGKSDSAAKSKDAISAKQEPKPSLEPSPNAIDVASTSSAKSQAAAKPMAQPLVVTAAAGTAEAAFQETLVAFQKGRIDEAFEFLPESYQADVESIVHLFAEKMDPELWAKSFELLTKVANVMKTNKSLILNLDILKQQSARLESIKPHWDGIASGIYDVATSEVADVENLKRCDVKRLLGSASNLLNGMPLPQFGDVSVTTTKSDSESATLSYRESKDGELKEVEFVKVQGKWIPKSLASGWSAGIDGIKTKLAGMPALLSSVKSQVMQQFTVVGTTLDKMQQAKTAEELNGAVFPLFLSISFGTQLAQQAMMQAEINSQRGTAIRIEINRELSDDDQTKLKDAVSTALGSKPDYEMIANDGKTRFRFSAITDADAVVAILQKHFDGADVRLNSETKTIQVELK